MTSPGLMRRPRARPRSDAAGAGLQGVRAWPKLARDVRAAAGGDASGFVPEHGRYPDQSTGVTECVDWPRPASRAELEATIARLRRACYPPPDHVLTASAG